MDANDSPNRLVLHDRPFFGWLMGLGLLALGIYLLFTDSRFEIGLVILGMGGLTLALVGAPLTIIADRNEGTLTLQYNYLVYKRVRQYALDEIVEVVVRSSRSRRSTTYQVALITEAGNEVPLRNSSSSGYGSKQKIANRLSEFLGLVEAGGRRPIAQTVQQALRGQFDGGQSGQTDGVKWQLEAGRVGNIPATRWFSPDFTYPGQFLLLAQKPAGSSNLLGNPRGILGGVSKLLYRQMTTAYGLDADETPGLDDAELLEQIDPQIERHFMPLSSGPISARRLLNPWVIRPLAGWAEAHPLRQGQSMHAGKTLQLVLLFSPQGVRLTFLNAATPEQAQEIGALGVEVTAAVISYS